jgi:signal transduction histidine kinase
VKNSRGRFVELRTRILLLAWLLSILPLVALYLVFAEVLGTTRALIAKDAGEYARQKTNLVNAAIQEDMTLALRNAAETLTPVWQAAYETSPDVGGAVAKFLTRFENSNQVALIFDEMQKLIGVSSSDLVIRSGPNMAAVERELLARYLVVTQALPPTEYHMLLAAPRGNLFFWRNAAQRYGDDFSGEIQTKFDAAVVNLRISAFSSFLALCLLALLLSRWLTTILTRPVEKLAGAMESFDGQTPVQLPAMRRDEIGWLTERFSDMTAKLVEARKALEAKQEALEKADEELMRLNLHLERRISERTSDLQLALTRLRELDQNKDDFLSLVSHELKTPLTSITASAEALLAKDLPLSEEGRARFLEIISNEAQRLTRLINDLLDLTSLEAGRIHFRLEPTDLYELVRRTADAYRLSIQQKGLAFDVMLSNDPRLRKTMMDPDRVAQVVTNLLGNAIKFTERGHISVSLEVVLTDAAEPMARLIVADTGIGIRPEDEHKVFNRFQQIEQIDTHHEGVGLGMPISRMIAEALGGEIHFASKPGHGTAFTVSLPLHARLAPRPAKNERRSSTLLADAETDG